MVVAASQRDSAPSSTMVCLSRPFLEVVLVRRGFFCGEITVYNDVTVLFRHIGSGDGRSSSDKSTGDAGGVSRFISRSFADMSGVIQNSNPNVPETPDVTVYFHFLLT